MYWRDRLACFGARSRGTCTNRLTISRQEVEERVLVALRDKLMRRDLFEDFCREYVRELNRLRMEHRASLSHGRRELAAVAHCVTQSGADEPNARCDNEGIAFEECRANPERAGSRSARPSDGYLPVVAHEQHRSQLFLA